MSQDRHERGPGGRRMVVQPVSVVLLLVLLILPTYALHRLSELVDWRLLAAIPIASSVFAFFAYRSDKRSAETGSWRTPEITLHVLAMLGGWPGAFLAQRIFRHKTSKISFQITFWAVVLLHEFAAFDSLNGWRATKEIIRIIKEFG